MNESEYTTPPLKTCTKCGDEKPREAFSRQSANKDGFRARCKACSADASAAYNAAYRAEHRDERAAYDAAYHAEHREEKAAYYAAWRAEHRDEQAAYSAAYNAEHRDEAEAYHAAYRAAHREEKRAYQAAYNAAHYEECRARCAAYSADHREDIAAYKKVWRASHSEEIAACNRNREARQQGNGGTHTAADIRAQYARQNGRCYWQATDECIARNGKLEAKYHVDHVMPVILGGSNGPENLVIACPTCNLRKGAKHPQDFCGRLL